MDLNIFKSDDEYCFGKSGGINENKSKDVSITSCTSLNRVLHALKYYKILNPQRTPSHVDIFSNFILKAYPQFLNDYQHVIANHEVHLELIHDQIVNGI